MEAFVDSSLPDGLRCVIADGVAVLTICRAAKRTALERARNAVSLVFTWPREDASGLREIYEAIAALAANCHGLIFDRSCAGG